MSVQIDRTFVFPEGQLESAINQTFGSFDAFKQQLSALAVGVQGSGWAWLGYNPKSKGLALATCANQDPLQATTGKHNLVRFITDINTFK